MARELRSLGFDASALDGGYNAWRAAYPVEPILGRVGSGQWAVGRER